MNHWNKITLAFFFELGPMFTTCDYVLLPSLVDKPERWALVPGSGCFNVSLSHELYDLNCYTADRCH